MKNLFFTVCLFFFLGFSVKAQIDTAWISNGLFPGASSTAATVVQADQAGNIYAAGSIYSYSLPYENLFVIKYEPNGEVLWLQTFASEDTLAFEPNTLCLDDDGNAYITFMRHCINSSTNYWAIAVQKYNASDGTLLWTSELADSQFNGFEWQVKPKYMTIDDNFLYLSGTKFESGIPGSEMLAMKVDFNGNILWTATHKGSGMNANAKGVAVDESGNVYVAGDAWNTSIDYFLVKLDPEGDLIWDAFLDGDVYHNTDIAESVLVDDDGNVFITGYNQISSNLKDIVTAKYNQDGVFQWKQSYGNPDYRDNNAYYLGMDENGDLYVGGYSAYEDPYPGTGKDYILLKYNQSGDLLWDARFDHFNYYNDHPFDFDMGPDGSVYVCGISVKSCYPSEFITVVKYNTQGEFVWNFCVPQLYGTPWGIDVINNDEFVVASGAFDTIMVKEASIIKYTSAPTSDYGADITNIFFESQIAPPVIDYDNQSIIVTVHDTTDLQYLVPYIAISDFACMYPDDEDTTSFVVPVWYNVTSFDNVEKWWYVTVVGGYVGLDDMEISDFEIYPNPARGKFELRSSIIEVEYCRIELYNLIGEQMEVLFDGKSFVGHFEFDVKDLPAGVYLCSLLIGTHHETKKLFLID